MELVDLNGPGFNYTLKYRRSDEQTWKKVVIARTESQFTILNAGVNKLWYFKIRTSNNVGLGPTCLENSSWSNREIANKSSKRSYYLVVLNYDQYLVMMLAIFLNI